MVVAATLVAVFIGLMLVRAGLRGPMRDLHPRCRRCGFELTGLTMPRTCPECGRSVRYKGEIVEGRRGRRPRLLWAGVGVVLFSVLVGGTLIYGLTTSKNWTSSKPTMLLTWEARLYPADRVQRQLAELTSRIASGQVSQPEVGSLLNHALEVQTRPEFVARADWLMLLGTAHTSGLMTRSQEARYLEQSLEVQFVARRRNRPGAEVPVRVTLSTHRLGSPSVITGGVIGARARYKGASEWFPLEGARTQTLLPRHSVWINTWLPLPAQDSTLEAEVTLQHTGPGGVHQWTVIRSVPVEIAPESEAVPRLVEDEAECNRIAATLAPMRVYATSIGNRRAAQVLITDLPESCYPLVVRAVITDPATGVRHVSRSMTFAAVASSRIRTVGSVRQLPSFVIWGVDLPEDMAKVDVTLETAFQEAEQEPIDEVLRFERTFKDVPLDVSRR